LRKVDN